jgi:hypothetical protein
VKRIALVLVTMAIVGLMAAGAWAGCPGMGSKTQGSDAGKVPEGTTAEQAGDMPSGCHMQMNPGASESSTGEVGQPDVKHAEGCCVMMGRGMCAQRMNPGCPMMMGQAPGCGQGASGRQAECSRDSKCDHGRNHGGRGERVCKGGGMGCGGAKVGKAHRGSSQMGCEALKGRHGYATVIL